MLQTVQVQPRPAWFFIYCGSDIGNQWGLHRSGRSCSACSQRNLEDLAPHLQAIKEELQRKGNCLATIQSVSNFLLPLPHPASPLPVQFTFFSFIHWRKTQVYFAVQFNSFTGGLVSPRWTLQGWALCLKSYFSSNQYEIWIVVPSPLSILPSDDQCNYGENGHTRTKKKFHICIH